VPIIRDGQPRTLTNRANAKTKYFAAPSFKRRGRIKTSRDQLTTQGEHGSITACDDALCLAAVRANELGGNWSLRNPLLRRLKFDRNLAIWKERKYFHFALFLRAADSCNVQTLIWALLLFMLVRLGWRAERRALLRVLEERGAISLRS
jgi:hypothetical protein